jgi:hypothetical protein
MKISLEGPLRNLILGLSLSLLSLMMVHTLPVSALETGRDVFIPAAARTGSWVTDLYLLNPGDESTDLTLYWLHRNRSNPDPVGVDYTLAPGESLVLSDVIAGVFNLEDAAGAFRVISQQQLVVSTRIYNLQGGVTFGQGFEGVPRHLAVATGDATDIVGLTNNTSFRSNLILVDTSGSGSTVELSLRDSNGVEVASRSYSLSAYEPMLEPVTRLYGVTELDSAVLHAEVTSGSAIIVASKIDNDPGTGDPTTLEAWRSDAGYEDDGVYQISIYDSAGYATGGSLTIRDGAVTNIDATYTNWDKGGAAAECTHTFRFGSPESGSHELTEYAGGVTFTRIYDNGAMLTWTLSLTVDDGQTLAGSVDVVGSDFPAALSGCNGEFPRLRVRGGKAR